MSELGDTFKEWKMQKAEKRNSNLRHSVRILNEHGISYQVLSETHLRVGPFDFWPSTGLFIERATNKRNRGIKNLLKKLGDE